MSQINVDTIKKADGSGSLTVPAETGTVVIKDGSNNVTLNDITAGGIYLGGTGAANYLDDYEEGTWTPDFDVEGAGDMTVSTQVGVYTKVGNMVHIQGKIDITGVTGASSSDAWQIIDLPFTAASDSGTTTIPITWRATGLASSANALTGFITAGSNAGRMEVFTGTGTVNSSTYAQNGTSVIFSITYRI